MRKLIQKILQFAERKGFYMILGLCVIAIGVSAYVLFFTAPQTEVLPAEVLPSQLKLPDTQASNNVPDIKMPAETKPEPEKTEEEPKPVKRPADTTPPQTTVSPPASTAPAAKIEPEKPTNSVQVNASAPVKQPIFTLPVQSAEVQREYSGNTLVFDPTMSDWRVHGGTDFSCKEGDNVMAVLDGTVTEIFQDTMMGPCIRLDHGTQLESLYCGVTPREHLEVGVIVEAGETLGRVDSQVLAESAQECHVHLEMTEEGIPVDPMSILK